MFPPTPRCTPDAWKYQGPRQARNAKRASRQEASLKPASAQAYWRGWSKETGASQIQKDVPVGAATAALGRLNEILGPRRGI